MVITEKGAGKAVTKALTCIKRKLNVQMLFEVLCQNGSLAILALKVNA